MQIVGIKVAWLSTGVSSSSREAVAGKSCAVAAGPGPAARLARRRGRAWDAAETGTCRPGLALVAFPTQWSSSTICFASVGGAESRAVGGRTITRRWLWNEEAAVSPLRRSPFLADVDLSQQAVHAWFTLFLPKHKPQTIAANSAHIGQYFCFYINLHREKFWPISEQHLFQCLLCA